MTPTVADVWSGASYERIAETFAPIHERVVATLAPGPGERVLDVACGTGGVALRAARTGADVVGLDISADQIAKARRAATREGLEFQLDEGDCQDLPYGDSSFDAVASVFGAIFAESHARAAREIARVTRPGGHLALTAWPESEWSHVGARLGREAPPGDDNLEWGRPEYACELLDSSFELAFESGEWVVRAASAEALWELVSTSVPPLKAWLDTIDDERRAEAEQAYVELFDGGEFRRHYLLVLGTRR